MYTCCQCAWTLRVGEDHIAIGIAAFFVHRCARKTVWQPSTLGARWASFVLETVRASISLSSRN